MGSPAGISNVEIVDSNEVTATSIVRNDESLLYYGNVDKVIPPGSKTEGVGSDIGVVTNSYENIKTINQLYNGESENTTFVDKITIPVLGTVNLKDSERYTNSPVSIKYKSGKHAVFALNKQNGNRVIILIVIQIMTIQKIAVLYSVPLVLDIQGYGL